MSRPFCKDETTDLVLRQPATKQLLQSSYVRNPPMTALAFRIQIQGNQQRTFARHGYNPLRYTNRRASNNSIEKPSIGNQTLFLRFYLQMSIPTKVARVSNISNSPLPLFARAHRALPRPSAKLLLHTLPQPVLYSH